MSLSKELQNLCKANQSFLCSLYKAILEDTPPGQNIFFSPFSISVALSMALVGARLQTEAQMKDTLGFGELDQERLHTTFKNLLSDVGEASGPVSIANGLFVQKDYQLQQSFVNTAVDAYGAESKNVNFQETSEVLKYINGWVKSATREKIPKLLDDVDPLTRVIIINAIYFKSQWMNKFDPKETKTSSFHLNKNDTMQVKMMKLEEDFRHSETPDFQVLELPYKDGKTSMVIFLPREIDGLGKIESQLSPEFIEDSLSKLNPPWPIELELPSFKLEQKYTLAPVLQNMGMVDLFLPKVANLQGLSTESDLFVSEVIHKSVVEVNEEGTEAAAATSVGMMLCCLKMPTPFKVDHPFLFCIVHNDTGSILFIGSVKKPPALSD